MFLSIRALFLTCSVLLIVTVEAQINVDAATRLASLLASSVASNIISNTVGSGQPSAVGPSFISSADIQRSLLKVLKQMSDAASVTTESPDDMLANSITEARGRFIQSLARLIRGDLGEAASFTDRLTGGIPLEKLAEGLVGSGGEENGSGGEVVTSSDGEQSSSEDSTDDPANSDLMVGLAKAAGKPPTLVPFRSVLSKALLDTFGNDQTSSNDEP